MFIDEAVITVRGGNGGDGCVSFRREKYVPKGGPDGGNGGTGGSVVLAADDNVNTLLDYRGRHDYNAGHGEAGRFKQQTGADGEDLVLSVPPGTMVYDERTGEMLADIGPGDRFVVAEGGRGGFGNEHFKTSTHQTPRQATPGESGVQRSVRLELRLIADVGLVGLPNAGKSTLLASITDAHPKIADYPFTTLAPQLGIAKLDSARRLVIADIPGLIEGAAEGAGLGHEFLRHIERTRILVHLVECRPVDGSDPVENYRLIRAELDKYSPTLAERDEVVCFNKLDLFADEAEAEAALRRFASRLNLVLGRDVLGLSAATRTGTRQMLERLWAMLNPSVQAWKATTS